MTNFNFDNFLTNLDYSSSFSCNEVQSNESLNQKLSTYYVVSTNSEEEKNDYQVKEVVEYLHINKEPILIQKLFNESAFEPGIKNEFITYFGTLFAYGEIPVVQWTCRLFTRYYGLDKVIKGLLCIATYYHYAFCSFDVMMALAAIAHKSDEVKELAVRVLESNCTMENYYALCHIDTEVLWLREYIDQVISDFKEELCQY